MDEVKIENNTLWYDHKLKKGYNLYCVAPLEYTEKKEDGSIGLATINIIIGRYVEGGLHNMTQDVFFKKNARTQQPRFTRLNIGDAQ